MEVWMTMTRETGHLGRAIVAKLKGDRHHVRVLARRRRRGPCGGELPSPRPSEVSRSVPAVQVFEPLERDAPGFSPASHIARRCSDLISSASLFEPTKPSRKSSALTLDSCIPSAIQFRIDRSARQRRDNRSHQVHSRRET